MKELSPPALNLKRLVKETVPGEPILVVISPGADPSHVRLRLAQFRKIQIQSCDFFIACFCLGITGHCCRHHRRGQVSSGLWNKLALRARHG